MHGKLPGLDFAGAPKPSSSIMVGRLRSLRPPAFAVREP